MATAIGKKIGVNVSVTREVALTNSKDSSPNVLYFPTDSDSFVFNGKEYAASGSRNNISGTLDVTKAATATAINNAYDNLSTGQMLFYLISDSSGNLPSLKGETSVTFHTDVARLVNTTGAALGASVGDLFVVAKVKVLLVNVLICRILPLNDAKAANGSFPGSMGLESVWDKTQINKVPGLETKANNAYSIANANDFPTRSGSNMNDCLTQGVYPWCTLGRPAGSTGAYTLVVRRSSTADGNGYYTVEQTAYGREGELGQVYKRLVFVKDSTAEYGEWIRIDESGGGDSVYQIPGEFSKVSTSSVPSLSQDQLGDAAKLYEAIITGKIIKDEVQVATYVVPASTEDYVILYGNSFDYHSINIRFNTSHDGYVVIRRIDLPMLVDDLETDSSNKALSAKQGKLLNDMLNTLAGNFERIMTSASEEIDKLHGKTPLTIVIANTDDATGNTAVSVQFGSILPSVLLNHVQNHGAVQFVIGGVVYPISYSFDDMGDEWRIDFGGTWITDELALQCWVCVLKLSKNPTVDYISSDWTEKYKSLALLPDL